jgi:hypothetical protein
MRTFGWLSDRHLFGDRAVDCPVDGWPRNREQFAKIGDGVFAGVVHPFQLTLLFGRQLWLSSLELALGSGNGHSFTGAHSDQIDFELSELAKMLKNIFPIGSSGS